MSDVRDGVNSQLVGTIAEINSIAVQVADLNQRIVVAQASGANHPANDLLDQRDQLLSDLTTQIRITTTANGDGSINLEDHRIWVKDLKHTWFGDANLDLEFTSGDLVAVFQAGQYEDAIEDNSGWATGDWDGDADFTSSDLVLAFQDGGYEQGPREPAGVPEPGGSALFAVCLLRALRSRRYG